jgi:hypothetical protein
LVSFSLMGIDMMEGIVVDEKGKDEELMLEKNANG